MPGIVAVNDRNFEQEVVQSAGLVVVGFCTDGSSPCALLDGVLDKVAASYAGRLKVVKCNISQATLAGLTYEVSSFPNLLFFKDGSVARRELGFVNERQLTRTIEEVMV